MSKEQDFFKRQIENVWPFAEQLTITCPRIKIKRGGSVVINGIISIQWASCDYSITNLQTGQSQGGHGPLDLIARAVGLYAEHLARVGLTDIIV